MLVCQYICFPSFILDFHYETSPSCTATDHAVEVHLSAVDQSCRVPDRFCGTQQGQHKEETIDAF